MPCVTNDFLCCNRGHMEWFVEYPCKLFSWTENILRDKAIPTLDQASVSISTAHCFTWLTGTQEQGQHTTTPREPKGKGKDSNSPNVEPRVGERKMSPLLCRTKFKSNFE